MKPTLNSHHTFKTCNAAASSLFPTASKHGQAFMEYEHKHIQELPYLRLLDLNDDFWAYTLIDPANPSPAVYHSKSDQFCQYQPSSGIYSPISESHLIGKLINNLNVCSGFFPSLLKYESFLPLKNRQRLKSVVERAKDLLAVDDLFFKDQSKCVLNLKNGIFNFGNNTFSPHTSKHPILQTLPVEYNSEAKCELFLHSFLAHILEAEDIDLLQRYCSQILHGHNHSQKILVLTGDSGWGKSTLLKILGALLGWDSVGIVRDQLYKDGSELIHYQYKHLLYHPDMPSQFLNHKESSIFKQLVGSDPLWADGNEGRTVIEGNFPVILACNGKPQICIDQDSDAWLRRLIVISFKKPDHETHLGKLAEMLIRSEASGILNWLLEGHRKLIKENHQLNLTPAQKFKAVKLVSASESPFAFVRCCLVKKKDTVMGAAELYEIYQKWCQEHQLPPFASKEFRQIVKNELEMVMGLKYRRDLIGDNGRAMRGWKHVGVLEVNQDENGEIKSV